MLSSQAFKTYTLCCNFPTVPNTHACTHPHARTHAALILQHVKFSSETQILHSGLSKLVCKHQQWAGTRLLHFWPGRYTLARAPHYKCVVAPLTVRRNPNNATPMQGCNQVCQAVHQRLIQSGQQSDSKTVSDHLIPTAHYRDGFSFFFSCPGKNKCSSWQTNRLPC